MSVNQDHEADFCDCSRFLDQNLQQPNSLRISGGSGSERRNPGMHGPTSNNVQQRLFVVAQ